MLDLQKMLSGLWQNGGSDPTQKQPVPQVDPTKMGAGETPGINPGVTPMQPAATLPQPGQTPGINPNVSPYGDISRFKPMVGIGDPGSAPLTQATQAGAGASGSPAGIDWKARILGGLQGLQAGSGQQSQAPPTMQPMDMEQIKQLQFAHTRQGGIIPPKGRY